MRVLTFSGVLLDSGEMQLEPGFVIEAEKPSGDGEVTVEALDRDDARAAARPVRIRGRQWRRAPAGGGGRAGRLPGEGERAARDL